MDSCLRLLVALKVARWESCFGIQMLRSSSRRCVEKLIEVRTFCATLLSMLSLVNLMPLTPLVAGWIEQQSCKTGEWRELRSLADSMLCQGFCRLETLADRSLWSQRTRWGLLHLYIQCRCSSLWLAPWRCRHFSILQYTDHFDHFDLVTETLQGFQHARSVNVMVTRSSTNVLGPGLWTQRCWPCLVLPLRLAEIMRDTFFEGFEKLSLKTTCLSCQELPAPRKGIDSYNSSKNDDRCPWDQKLAKSWVLRWYLIFVYICIYSIRLKFVLSSEVAKFEVGVFVYTGVDFIFDEFDVCPSLPSHEARAFGGLLWRSFICIKLCKHPTEDFNGFDYFDAIYWVETRFLSWNRAKKILLSIRYCFHVDKDTMLAPEASPNLTWQMQLRICKRQQAVNQANANEQWFQRETYKIMKIFIMIICTHMI